MDGGFAIIMIVVLVAGAGLSLLQHRTYQRATRRMAAKHQGELGSFLVSGRGKGWLRGSVVLLVVNSATSTIEAAEAMSGASVFAQFRPRPELLGPVEGATDKAGDKRLRKAVEEALGQYRLLTRKRGSAGTKH